MVSVQTYGEDKGLECGLKVSRYERYVVFYCTNVSETPSSGSLSFPRVEYLRLSL